MHNLMKKTCEALEDIDRSGSVNIMDRADREIVSELVDLKKNILKVQKLEEEMDGYSQDGPYDGYDGGSSNSNRGKHLVRGHYSRDGGSSYRGGRSSREEYSRGGYSRDDSRSEMMEYIEKAMDAATDEDRETIKRFMRQLERA